MSGRLPHNICQKQMVKVPRDVLGREFKITRT